MGMIWLIIKIILIALLVILALLITIITIVLVAPIRYEAYMARYNEIDYDIRIRYLIGIQALFIQENDKKNHVIKVFGKVIYKNKVVEEEGSKDASSETAPLQEKENTAKETPNTESVLLEHEPKVESVDLEQKEIRAEESIIEENTEETIEKERDKDTQQEIKEQKADIKEEAIKEVSPPTDHGQDLEVVKEVNPQLKEEAKEGIKEATEEVVEETVETVKKMPFSWLKKLILDKTMYSSIKQVVRYTWYIIKYISPYEWDFEIVIGKENPSDTGELIAALMMFYPLYGNHGIIRGDFEKACLEGGFLVKGKFKIGGILIYILRCILSKSVRKMIYLIYKLRKEEQKNGK